MSEPVGGPADAAFGGPVEGSPDGGWSRVHWLTPYLRSWSVIAVGAFVVVQNVGNDVLQRSLPGGELAEPEGPSLSGRALLIVAGVVAAVFAVGVVLAVVSWRATRYRITAEAVELHQGVVFRRQSSARLDRIQAVDVVRPLIARLFGMAQLSVEVAGSGDSKLLLRFLRVPDAMELRNRVLAGAAGLDVAAGVPAPHAPEQPVLAVPPGRLVASILLGAGSATALAAAAIGVTFGVVLDVWAPVAFLLTPALGAIGSVWSRFTRGYGFVVGIGADGLRLRHGLLEHQAQTLPPGRVQAVRVEQPLWWRPADWWRLEVNVAGYGADKPGESRETVLVPVGTRAEALRVLDLVVGNLGWPPGSAHVLLADALDGQGPTPGYVTAPRRARRLDPIGWRRLGVCVAPGALVLRSGRLQRRVVVVPHARAQSLGARQGPWQRRLRLASLQLHSTPGPIAPRIDHLDLADAAALLDAQAARARQARASAGPERWLEPRPPAGSPLSPPAGSPVSPPGAAGSTGPPAATS